MSTGEETKMMQELTEAQFAKETLERYAGCEVEQFRSNLLLTNFPRYVDYFSKTRNVPVIEGSAFKVAHDPKEDVSILDFKIGSPAAALVVDLCSFMPIKTSVLLGMCGGLRRRYVVGDYLVPVASIRGEGTSDFYFPSEVPALANFLMQKAVTEVLETQKATYHIGITYTTNMRFWEYSSRARSQPSDFISIANCSKKQSMPCVLNRHSVLSKQKWNFLIPPHCRALISMRAL